MKPTGKKISKWLQGCQSTRHINLSHGQLVTVKPSHRQLVTRSAPQNSSHKRQRFKKILHQQCIGHENDIQSRRNTAQSVYSFAATH